MKYYKVKVIQQTAPNAYHVVCTNDQITHRMFPLLELALEQMRALNALERKKLREVKQNAAE